MQDSAVAFINVNLPEGALPLPVLLLLLVGFFVVVALLIQKANWYKGYAKDFPTQTSVVIAGIGGFVATLLVNLCRGALGMASFDGSDMAYMAGCTMAGVGGGMLMSKRFSAPEYMEGKAKVEAAKAGAAPPSPAVNVEGDATVNTTAERRVPAPSRSTDVAPPAVPKGPAFGGKSR